MHISQSRRQEATSGTLKLLFSSLPQGLVSLLALSLACTPVTRAAGFDCKFDVQGRSFDLSALDKVFTHTSTVETPPTTLKNTYLLNPCTALSKDSSLQDRDQCPEGTRACLTIVNQKEGESDRIVSVVPIAAEELNPTISFAVASKGRPDMLQVALHGGSYEGHPRWANLTLYCDPSKDSTEPAYWLYHRTAEEAVLSVEWATKYACPLDSKGTPDSGGKAKEGSSIGRLLGDFILMLLILLVLYFVGGAYYQYSQYGSRGWDLLPNRAFWADLPYVLRDLFRGTGRNSSGYSAL